MRFVAPVLVLLTFVACKEPSTREARDPAPAPGSALARALGADDAGRGHLALGECPGTPDTAIDTSRPLGSTLRRGYGALMAPEFDAEVGFFETRKPAPTFVARSALRLELGAPDRALAGEPIALRLGVTNAGEDPVILTRARDGSFEHMRAPFVDVFAEDLGSHRTFRFAPGPGYGRCGNVNPKTAADYVTVAPGQSVPEVLGDWSRRSLDVAIDRVGTYRVWVTYTACDWPGRGVPLGADEEAPLGAFEGSLISPSRTIRIVVP